MTDSHLPSNSPALREGVVDHHFVDPLQLMMALSPSQGLLPGDPSTWIYRGQACAEWRLQARGLRDPTAFEEFGLAGDASDHSTRSYLQEQILQRFHEGLDRLGIVIPIGSPREHEAAAIMALAQHHGLPTTLLDWTRRSIVAAYFASVEAADTKRRAATTTHLAVWALGFPRELFRRYDAQELSLYQPPAATNPNLRAQSGLFTMRSLVGDDWPCLEEHLRRLRLSPKPMMLSLHRFTLPVSAAPCLLRLISYEGIDGASMFPGADGVVRAMRERALWDDAERLLG